MKKTFLIFILLSLAIVLSAVAQNDDSSQRKHILKASIGYGGTAPYESDVEFYGSGFYAQAEYVYKVKSWLDIRPYAGFIFANSDETMVNSRQNVLTSDTNAFLLGGKVRVKAPIPWVAPFVEVGGGMSIGEFETVTNSVNFKESGLIFHIPISLGLALGPKHNFDIMFTYYFHNAVEQIAGAAAIGFSFPLN